MLAIMAVAGAIGDLVNLPGIVGAFLAGLAVDGAAQDNPARMKREFFGKALFIPSFFIVTGILIDPVAFAGSLLDHFPLALGIIACRKMDRRSKCRPCTRLCARGEIDDVGRNC